MLLLITPIIQKIQLLLSQDIINDIIYNEASMNIEYIRSIFQFMKLNQSNQNIINDILISIWNIFVVIIDNNKYNKEVLASITNFIKDLTLNEYSFIFNNLKNIVYLLYYQLEKIILKDLYDFSSCKLELLHNLLETIRDDNLKQIVVISCNEIYNIFTLNIKNGKNIEPDELESFFSVFF